MPTINLEITEERRADMLVGALEGGSNYWYNIGVTACRIIEPYRDKERYLHTAMLNAIKDGKSIPIHDIETNEKIGEFSKLSIEIGEQLMAEQQPKHFLDIINEEDDAITADVWFQFCVLKSIVYG